MEYRYIDLFAGIGGIRLGFEQALSEEGHTGRCVFTSEIKPHAIDILKQNFNHEILAGDITKIDAREIPDFDILLAGFPCQSFSTAGKGLGFLDTRGTLFFEIERILKAKKPKGFILENVEGLIKHDLEKKEDKIGQTLSIILDSLRKMGYKVTWKLLDSKDFGVPQSRKRVFIIGHNKYEIPLDNFNKSQTTFKDIMEHNIPTKKTEFTNKLMTLYKPKELYGKAIKDKRGGKNNIHSWDLALKGKVTEEQKTLLNLLLKERRKKEWAIDIGIDWMDGMPLTKSQIFTFYENDNLKYMLDDLVNKGYLKYEHPKKLVTIMVNGNQTRRERVYDTEKPKGYNIVAGKLSFEYTKIIDINGLSPTLVATDVHKLGVVDTSGIRTLTIREGLRLFGYPEEYMMENTNLNDAFDLLGNTVVIPVVKQVSLKLIKK